MNTEFTVRPAILETLPDVHALWPDPQERERRTADTLQRVRDGKVSPEQFLILRSERGVEGNVFLNPAPQVSIFPRCRSDVPGEALTAFLTEIRARQTDPARQLVLDSTLAPLDRAPALAAGWVLDDEHVVYSTDLRARPFARDSHVGEVQIGDPAIHPARAALGRVDWTPREGWTLFALRDGGEVVALGAVGPGGRPGEAGVDLIGVLPEFRGRGFGRRLHAHLLAHAAGSFQRHYGGTDAGNHAMRRIFGKNGSELAFTQLYFRQP